MHKKEKDAQDSEEGPIDGVYKDILDSVSSKAREKPSFDEGSPEMEMARVRTEVVRYYKDQVFFKTLAKIDRRTAGRIAQLKILDYLDKCYKDCGGDFSKLEIDLEHIVNIIIECEGMTDGQNFKEFKELFDFSLEAKKSGPDSDKKNAKEWLKSLFGGKHGKKK